MNFLAHAYLSFEEPEVLTGNMISDFVKGREKFQYPLRVQEGITLHRTIDTFTDAHEVTRKTSLLFKPVYGRYHLAFMDVVYDHFLAADLASRPKNFFSDFVNSTYQKLEENAASFPVQFRHMFPYMKRDNWLFNYQFHTGIEKSFAGLVHRARYIDDSRPAFDIFGKHYNELNAAYDQFFPELLRFALEKFAEIH